MSTAQSQSRARLVALVLACVGVLGLVGVAVAYLADDPAPVPGIEQGAGDVVEQPGPQEEPAGAAGGEAAPAPTITATRPAGSTANGGIVVGRDGVAGAEVPDDAVVVAVYLDFMCPYCAAFEQVNGEMLADLRADGTAVVEYHLVSILDRFSNGTAYSTRAATAAALVADQAPELFDLFTTALFVVQPAENTEGLSDSQIADVARRVGVPDAVADAIESGEYVRGADSFARWVGEATAVASYGSERFGTPTIIIDGEVLDPRVHDWTVPGQLELAITG